MKLIRLRFRNYRAFKDWSEIDLRSISILYGWNSAGKSSIARLLVWLSQSFQKVGRESLDLSDRSIFSDQQFREIVHFGNIAEPLELHMIFEQEGGPIVTIEGAIQFFGERMPARLVSSCYKLGERTIFDCQLQRSESAGSLRYKLFMDDETRTLQLDEFVGFIPQIVLVDLERYPSEYETLKNAIETIRKVNYLRPHRADVGVNITPKYLAVPRVGYNEDGFRGEYMAQILNSEYQQGSETFHRIVADFQRFFPDRIIDVESQPNIFNIVVRLRDESKYVNLASVGEGMIQVLPILVMCNLPGPHSNSIDIVEQPELHLHPGAQGSIIELFKAAVERQRSFYLVETHAENILLRLRSLIAEEEIDSSNVSVSWFQQDDDGVSTIKPISIDGAGEVDWWPDGVFSEDFEEVKRLRRAQKKRGVFS